MMELLLKEYVLFSLNYIWIKLYFHEATLFITHSSNYPIILDQPHTLKSNAYNTVNLFCKRLGTFNIRSTWICGRSTRMKGFVSISSSMVEGTVACPACRWPWAHNNLPFIFSLSGSTVRANCKFFTVYCIKRELLVLHQKQNVQKFKSNVTHWKKKKLGSFQPRNHYTKYHF